MTADGNVLDEVRRQIAAGAGALSPTERVVATFFADEHHRVPSMTALEVARHTGTSDATVVRAAQALGYAGYSDLRRRLRDAVPPTDDLRAKLVATLGDGQDDGLLGQVVADHTWGLEAMTSEPLGEAVDRAVGLIVGAVRLVLAGTGPSAPLADYGAVIFNRIGVQTTVLSHTGTAAADELLRLKRGDVAVVLAYGRISAHVDALLEVCSELDVPVVLCTDTIVEPDGGTVRAVIRSGRGRPGRYSSHATTTLLLEALMIGVAGRRPSQATATLESLNRLRRRISGRPFDVR